MQTGIDVGFIIIIVTLSDLVILKEGRGNTRLFCSLFSFKGYCGDLLPGMNIVSEGLFQFCI